MDIKVRKSSPVAWHNERFRAKITQQTKIEQTRIPIFFSIPSDDSSFHSPTKFELLVEFTRKRFLYSFSHVELSLLVKDFKCGRIRVDPLKSFNQSVSLSPTHDKTSNNGVDDTRDRRIKIFKYLERHATFAHRSLPRSPSNAHSSTQAFLIKNWFDFSQLLCSFQVPRELLIVSRFCFVLSPAMHRRMSRVWRTFSSKNFEVSFLLDCQTVKKC